MSSLSTHVLDNVTGRPAEDMEVTLETLTEVDAGVNVIGSTAWLTVGRGRTDPDGRNKEWDAGLTGPGSYRLTFHTGTWFAERNRECFYPEVTITFAVTDEGHYHVPLLLAPYAYSTYRGS